MTAESGAAPPGLLTLFDPRRRKALAPAERRLKQRATAALSVTALAGGLAVFFWARTVNRNVTRHRLVLKGLGTVVIALTCLDGLVGQRGLLREATRRFADEGDPAAPPA